MTEVFLHVYDVANSASPKTNSVILQLNKLFKDGIGLGGIFHSAIEVYDKTEWSFGYCVIGSGVFECPRTKNPMYIFRESLSLGYTSLSSSRVKEILTELSSEWPGYSYDVLSKNCNHFCNEFCEKLEVEKLPAWVNRFANAGETAVEAAETTMRQLKQARTEVVSASKVAYRVLFGGASTVSPDPELLENSNLSGSGRNSYRLSFLKTPSNLFSRSSSGSQTQSVDGSAHIENAESKEDESAVTHTL